jgi:hypothetical protein
MAALNTTELAFARNFCEGKFSPVGYTKPQINAALQAIEDTMRTTTIVAGQAGQTVQQIVSAAIDASSAFNWSNAQKKILFAIWADLTFKKDSV